MSRDAKKDTKALVEELKKLDRDGTLAREGKKVAKAIGNLRKERRLSREELDRKATI